MTNIADVRLEDGSVQAIQVTPAGAVSSGFSQQNGIVGGAGNAQVTAIGAPYTPTKSGICLVIATVFGSDVTVDDPIVYQYVVDATSTTGAPGGTPLGDSPETESSHVGGLFAVSISNVGPYPLGVPFKPCVTVSSPALHDLTIAFAGFSIIELPAS
jgi:hypothetical protein